MTLANKEPRWMRDSGAFCRGRRLVSGRCIALGYTAPRRRSSGKARRWRLVSALPDGLRRGRPARRRRNPAPQPREARIRAATRRAGKALTRGVKIAAAHGPRPAGARTPPRGSAAGRRSGAGPLRREGQAEAEPHQRRQSRRRASAGRLAVAWPARAGGADGPTAPTEWGPGRAGAPTPRPARGRSGARPAKRPPQGAWPCGAGGYPRATAAAQLDRDAPRGRGLGPHISPTAAGGRGGRRPSRPGWAGVAARWPLGAGGTRPEGADGSPHQPAGLASSCLAVSSTQPRGRRVGRAGRGPGREARP